MDRLHGKDYKPIRGKTLNEPIFFEDHLIAFVAK